MGSVPCWSLCAACLIRSASATSKPSASPSPASISGAVAGSTGSSGFSGHLGMSRGYSRKYAPGVRVIELRDDSHGLEAFVVVDHDQFPVSAGGTRMLPDVSVDEVA